MALMCAGALVALMAFMMAATSASAATTVQVQSQSNIAELFILSELFDDENGDGLLGGDSDLRQLIILEELFAGGTLNSSVCNENGGLAELFILSRILDDDNSATTSAMDGDNNNDLAELFILSELFNRNTTLNAGTDLCNGNDRNLTSLLLLSEVSGDNGDTNLAELFILSELFAGGTGTGILGGNERVVIVERGDTLSGIALEVYGNASLYPIIADANNISNPNVIRVGQRLIIPELNGQRNLSELFILESVLGGDGNGLLNGDSNLAELFILTELFR